MKKLITTLFAMGAMALSSCAPTLYSADGAKTKLQAKEYSTEVLSYEEAKVRIIGLNYEAGKFTNAIYAKKGADENFDFIISFFFSSVDDADKFLSANSNENLGILNTYADTNLGANLTKKVGMTNNVAYVGSETAYTVAFGNI